MKSGRKSGKDYGTPPWNKGKRFEMMLGNKHAFRGEEATKGAGHIRAQKIFKEIRPCSVCKLDRGPKMMVRHHKDENPLNNSSENVEFMCRRCHLKHHNPTSYRNYKIKKTI